MRKISFLAKGIAVASLGVMCVQCSAEKKEVATNEEKQAGIEQPVELKLAYVDVDSLLSQYEFSKDLNETMIKKEENVRATLNQKARELQNQVSEFQRKAQNNAFLTQERMQQEQERLGKMQQNLQDLQNRLSTEMQSENQKNTIMLRDSIRNYLKEYNQKKRYSMIFSNAGLENLLYADSTFNITKEIVKGLNARYKKKSDK